MRFFGFIALVGVILALASTASANGRLKPSRSTLDLARTLQRGGGLTPRDPMRLGVPGGGERLVYPGLVVSTTAWTAQGTRFTVVRKDTVLGAGAVTQHERDGRKATAAERAEAVR